MTQVTKQIKIPNELLIGEVIEQLNEGREVTIKAAGRSMMPYIKDKTDGLVFKAVDKKLLATGDIVLAYTTDRRYVVHRIKEINGDDILLKGDGNLNITEHCSRDKVYGLLVYIERGEQRIDCNTASQRTKAAIMRNVWNGLRRIKYTIKDMIKPNKK